MLAGVHDALNDVTGSISTQDPGWLFVLPWSLRETGGVNHVVKSLIRCFKDGGEFTPQLLITSQVEKSDSAPVPERIAPIFLDVWGPIDDRRPLRSLLSFAYRFPGRYFALRSIVMKNNIRIINPHFPSLNTLMFLALRWLSEVNLQIVLSFHGSDVKNILSTVGLERLLWTIVLRYVDQVSVVSNNLGAELLNREPRIAGKLTTINNGVDLQAFATTSDLKSVSVEIDQRRTIISVGGFSAIKGHDVLVQAFSIVSKKVPNCRLLLVGKQGPELKRIRQLIGVLHLDQEVSIQADVPHERIPTLLSQAQLFVLASRREGFPLVLVEAAAARLPIACTRVGGTSEFIVEGITGRLVDIEDYVSLADAMIELLTNPQDAERIATNCYEYVRANLTWDHSYQKYLRLVTRASHTHATI